jgi:uncharacterized protein YdiU (UPF0061 family)
MNVLGVSFEHSYAGELPAACVAWRPAPAPAPRLMFFNTALADELGMAARVDSVADENLLAEVFCGNRLPEDARPVAQVYAGHQFGHFSPQLGDGRALLLGEVIDRAGRRRDLAFKGSGPTPFARGGDGWAALGPMLREVLIGEAMHALGIPTTRALAVVATGQTVQRETALPGACLTRVAASHLRIGSFEFFAARGDLVGLRQLADYAIARHDPQLVGVDQCYLEFLRAVVERQAALVARWMGVGFIHGVMNTDNVSIAGETLDYGPCAFMEVFDPGCKFSSIDHGGRYAWGRQPAIAHWNLCRLAEALLPLVVRDEVLAIALVQPVLDSFVDRYRQHWLVLMRDKLGLCATAAADEDADLELIGDWLDLLQAQQVDYTQAFWQLTLAAVGSGAGVAAAAVLRALFAEHAAFDAWFVRWQARAGEVSPQRLEQMRRVNPWLIPRNHQVEAALAAATAGDLLPFERLLVAVRRPCDENPAFADLVSPAPAGYTDHYRTFCGT